MKKIIVLLLCILFIGCSTAPLIRHRLFAKNCRVVIIGETYMYRHSVVKEKSGLIHWLDADYGNIGDTITVELGLPKLF